MNALPDVKLRVVTQLPAALRPDVGLNIDKRNGAYYLGLGFGSITSQPYISPDKYATSWQVYWDAVANDYVRIPYTLPTARVVSTSSTAATVSTGTKDFQVDPGLGWTFGTRVRATDNDNPANWIEGIVQSYDPSTGVAEIVATLTHGSGTISNWSIGIVGQPQPLSSFETISAAEATDIDASVQSAVIARFSSATPWARASYKRVDADPGHPGSYRSADRFLPNGSIDNTNGGWWEIDESVLTPQMLGATGLNSDDDTVAAQDFLDTLKALNRPGRLSAMHRCDSDVTLTAPGQTIQIAGGGPGTGFDFSQGSGRLTITGTASRIADMSTDMTKGGVSINFASAHGLSARDVIAVWNPTPGSWLAARDAYNAGEFFRVYSVASSTAVYLYGASFDTYDADHVEVWKISQVNVLLSDFTVKESPNKAIPIRVTYGTGRATGVRGDSVVSTCLEIDRCYVFTFPWAQAYNNSAFVNDEYGISIANSQSVRVYGGDLGATRHAVSIGGYEGDLNVVNRSLMIDSCDLMNYNGGAESADMHGNVEYVTYNNCICRNAAGIGGANITYINCQIWSHYDNSSGYAVYGSEIRGGLYRFINCVLNLQANGDLVSYGAIHLIPNLNNDMVEKFVLEVIGCHFRGAPGNSNGMAIQVDARDGANLKKVNVKIEHCTFDIGLLQGILFVRRNGGGNLQSDYLIVDPITYTGSGNPYFIYPDASIPSSIKRREMRQAGAAVVTTTASNLILASAQTLPLKYSKMPVETVSVGLADGSAASTIAGKVPVTKAYSLSTSQIRPLAQSADGTNFSAGTDVRLSWTTEVRDI